MTRFRTLLRVALLLAAAKHARVFGASDSDPSFFQRVRDRLCGKRAPPPPLPLDHVVNKVDISEPIESLTCAGTQYVMCVLPLGTQRTGRSLYLWEKQQKNRTKMCLDHLEVMINQYGFDKKTEIYLLIQQSSDDVKDKMREPEYVAKWKENNLFKGKNQYPLKLEDSVNSQA